MLIDTRIKSISNTGACRPSDRQRQRNEQLYNGCYYAAARKQQQRNEGFCAVRAEML
jgi:hypothetical protein